MQNKPTTIGIVIIGRNEGQRLKSAFAALQNHLPSTLYVDSGSTDGSVKFANSKNVEVHELDPQIPFSAGRARREGAEILINRFPNLEFIQFVDGDCALQMNWIEDAVDFIQNKKHVGIVCGILKEKAPERSMYNRMNALRWSAAVTGEIDACGGIFMIRRSLYESVGGFNKDLLTGEESELCSRIRKSGYRIIRLSKNMASHDSDLVKFSDWWKRAIWGGYGDAMEYEILNGNITNERKRETLSVGIWGIVIPLLSLFGIAGGIVLRNLLLLPIIGLIGYLVLTLKIMSYRIRQGDSVYDSFIYAILCVIRKIPYAMGFLRYKLMRRVIKQRPDPHAS